MTGEIKMRTAPFIKLFLAPALAGLLGCLLAGCSDPLETIPAKKTINAPEKPARATVGEVLANPARYEARWLEISGFVDQAQIFRTKSAMVTILTLTAGPARACGKTAPATMLAGFFGKSDFIKGDEVRLVGTFRTSHINFTGQPVKNLLIASKAWKPVP